MLVHKQHKTHACHALLQHITMQNELCMSKQLGTRQCVLQVGNLKYCSLGKRALSNSLLDVAGYECLQGWVFEVVLRSCGLCCVTCYLVRCRANRSFFGLQFSEGVKRNNFKVMQDMGVARSKIERNTRVIF